MKNKSLILLIVILAAIASFGFIYPHITIQTDDKLIACRYSDDTSEFETEISADERYVYWKERDVTWGSFDFKKFGPFYLLTFDIEKGNTITSKYALDPGFLEDFLSNAEIQVVEKDYKEIYLTTDDIVAMLAEKQALDTTQRYVCPDYDTATRIYYQLGDEENIMYLYEVDDLLVVQVGYPDEGPKFVAYK